MDFGIAPIVTNTGIMVFLAKFYEGQNKRDIKMCFFRLQGIRMICVRM